MARPGDSFEWREGQDRPYVGHVQAVGPAGGQAVPELWVLAGQAGREVVHVPELVLDEVGVDLAGGGEHVQLVEDAAEVAQLGAKLLPVVQPRLQLLRPADAGVGEAGVGVGGALAVTG